MAESEKSVMATACSNIALIKYWGKRDSRLFLPTKSSLSVTLDGLSTVTSVRFLPQDAVADVVAFDGDVSDVKNSKNVFEFLNFFRSHFRLTRFFRVDTHNTFPTSAGLASSASGFAALVAALKGLCKLDLSFDEMSMLARRGSGSASRSLHGGFVVWNRGTKQDGSDSFAEQIVPALHWPEFRILVSIVCAEQKKVSSRAGMQSSLEVDFYPSWIETSENVRLPAIRKAIVERDFERVGSLAEQDCLDMHKVMQETGLMYWNDGTKKLMALVKSLREEGIPCFFTIDAGPNVKILCLAKDEESILVRVKEIKEVSKVLQCSVGPASSTRCFQMAPPNSAGSK